MEALGADASLAPLFSSWGKMTQPEEDNLFMKGKSSASVTKPKRKANRRDSLDRALALQPDFTPAMTTKAQILFGARRFDDALAISDKIVQEHPDDPSMLFLHATISHEAHAYQREIAALKHLIELAQAQGQSTTGYEIYLGQAYAETGDAMPSLIAFKKAVDAPDISPEQRKFAQDCIDKIGERTGQTAN